MFLNSDRARFSQNADVHGSESAVYYTNRTLQGLVNPVGSEPVLRYRYSTTGVLGDRHPNPFCELVRFHIHRFAQIILEADPLHLKKFTEVRVVRVMQGSTRVGTDPCSVSELITGAQQLSHLQNTRATKLYDIYRNYGFAHDFHGKNTFVCPDDTAISLELLDVISPEALRVLSLLNKKHEAFESGVRACAWVSALGCLSPFPLPPPDSTRRDIPASPGSIFTLSIIDLTYFWRDIYEAQENGKVKPGTWKANEKQKREMVRACKLFGRGCKTRTALDTEHGTNIDSFGVSEEVFKAFKDMRDKIRTHLASQYRV